MKERPRPAEFLIRAFMFGFLTYMAVYVMYAWLGKEFSVPPVGDSQQLLNVDFADEILWSSGAALVFSFVWIYGSTQRWMTRLLNWVGAATTHGKEDIWDLTFSRLQAEVEYVHVRDLDRGITYAGWVRAYSETGKLRELLLRDAIVWDKTGDSIEVPLLYLARTDSDVHIEFPYDEERDEPTEEREGDHHAEHS